MAGQSAGALIRQMREQRMRWVELEPAADGAPAKRVRIIRPTEVEMAQFMDNPTGEVHIVHAQVGRFVVGWEGITGADLLGAAVGSSDAVDFDPALWIELVADRSHWLMQLSAKLTEIAIEHVKAVKAARKN